MGFAAKPLADGQIADSQGAIYTVPASTAGYVKQIYLYNTNAATQTIELWIDVSGTARRWRRLVLEQNEAADLLENGETIQLEAADTIEAVTTTASAVDYTVTGVEET